jgi:hypothetical protein
MCDSLQGDITILVDYPLSIVFGGRQADRPV